MRQEGNPLDLNNLPEEYGKQAVESSTTTVASSADASRVKKKSGGGGGKDDSAKVYECRFCSLKFCKSQALGGHMNRHRQERETETLNRARQLVFGNDTLASIGVGAHMSFRDVNMGGGATAPSTVLGGGFRGGGGGGVMRERDPCLQFRPVHPRPSPPPPPPPPYHYLYTAPPTTLHPMNYPATYPASPRQPTVGDYVIGHAVSSGDALMQPPYRGSFSCFGAPVTGQPATAAAAAAAAANLQSDSANCNCGFGCVHSRIV